jgi:arginyl-tRNA synthetase
VQRFRPPGGPFAYTQGLLSVGFDRYGSEEELVKDPIQHLFQVYVKINQERAAETERFNAGEITDADSTIHAAAKRVFKDMEDGELFWYGFSGHRVDRPGEPKAIAQWARFRDLSIEKLKETYKKLNIDFDVYWGESQVKPESMQRAIDVCVEKGLTCEDRGALLVDLVRFKMDKAIIRKAGQSHLGSAGGHELTIRRYYYLPDPRSRRTARQVEQVQV